MTERWRPIRGYEGLYEVSDAGRARTFTLRGAHKYIGHIARTKRNSLEVMLKSQTGKLTTRTVAIIVAETFMGPCPSGHATYHLDRDFMNNRLENLVYVPHSVIVGLASRCHDSTRKKAEENLQVSIDVKRVKEDG